MENSRSGREPTSGGFHNHHSHSHHHHQNTENIQIKLIIAIRSEFRQKKYRALISQMININLWEFPDQLQRIRLSPEHIKCFLLTSGLLKFTLIIFIIMISTFILAKCHDLRFTIGLNPQIVMENNPQVKDFDLLWLMTCFSQLHSRTFSNHFPRCSGTRRPEPTPQIRVFGLSQPTGRQTTYRVIPPVFLTQRLTFKTDHTGSRTISCSQVKVLRENDSALVPLQRGGNSV